MKVIGIVLGSGLAKSYSQASYFRQKLAERMVYFDQESNFTATATLLISSLSGSASRVIPYRQGAFPKECLCLHRVVS